VAERRRGGGGWQWQLELNALVLEGVGELKSVGRRGGGGLGSSGVYIGGWGSAKTG
jgi:hypothetical protein